MEQCGASNLTLVNLACAQLGQVPCASIGSCPVRPGEERWNSEVENLIGCEYSECKRLVASAVQWATKVMTPASMYFL